MSNTLTPARVSPPGRILNRELEARGWTQKDLAEITGRPHQTINGIIKGHKQITPETAIELAEALGTSAEFWTNLEMKYQLHLAQQSANNLSPTRNISRKSHLYSVAPIAEMINRGWLEATESIDDLEAQVYRFFGISQLEEVPQFPVSCRQSEGREAEGQVQVAWAKRVENIARTQVIPAFDRAKLAAAIPEILAYAQKAEDVSQIADKLHSLGVHFVIVPHLKKSFLDGAAFWIDERPVVALTLRHKRIDNFWFTLMHELGHVVAGHKGSYFDDIKKLGVNQEEMEANQLAADWLLDLSEIEAFVAANKPRFGAIKLEAFAESQHRHPGIVVGRLHNEGVIPYKNHQRFLVKVDRYLGDQISQ
jgi:HTH-type transcriptional regulator/antitoxin HigA